MAELSDYQKRIEKFVKERGFDKETVPEVFMLFLEEAGEFAKAARQISSVKVGAHSKKLEVENEAADVFWLLIDLCNRLGINLTDAFENKEKINQKRSWS
jgi:NTP pyrophosphatase (non-canonical NTP hydrolase)